MPLKSIPTGSLPLKKRPVVLNTSFRPFKKSKFEASQPMSLLSLTTPSEEGPLPGGCHGRTSRSGSFCRKNRYKGKYCKLHYYQHKKKVIEPKNLDSQDKRFTGADHEVRCLATTTRGRACAYIAVGSTKYCYLHADYDVNPPPRRIAKDSDKPHHGKSKKFNRRRTSAKLAEKHAAAKSPLLSMISTDQWYQKTVKIATGPLKGRIGAVEKWGNGWVSVKIPGVGMHNRRSFELYMEESDDRYASVSPSPSDTPSEDNSSKSSMARSSTPASVIKVTASSGDEESDAMPETPRPETHLVAEGLENPVALNTALTSDSDVPKVTPFGSEKPMAVTAKTSHLDLQLPEDYGQVQGMIFRPSMSDRAREHAAEAL